MIITGIATGDYDEEHKILRQRLHQTFSKLAGKDKVKEIIESNIQQIFIEIDLVMKENKTLDPGDIFMHASMNISTGMMFGQTHNFHDKEFKYLSSLIKVYNIYRIFHYQQIFRCVVALTIHYILIWICTPSAVGKFD